MHLLYLTALDVLHPCPCFTWPLSMHCIDALVALDLSRCTVLTHLLTCTWPLSMHCVDALQATLVVLDLSMYCVNAFVVLDLLMYCVDAFVVLDLSRCTVSMHLLTCTCPLDVLCQCTKSCLLDLFRCTCCTWFLSMYCVDALVVIDLCCLSMNSLWCQSRPCWW